MNGSAAEVRAARSAGPAAAGSIGVSLGAAGDFIKRQLALQAENRGQPADVDPDDDDPPPRPTLTIVGEGVRVRAD